MVGEENLLAAGEQAGILNMLEDKWAEGRFLCVGLDLVADSDGSLYEKAKLVVDATRDIAAAFKPNSAFYERGGAASVEELEKLVAYIKELAPDVPVIWDAKRADIASTNEGYADARDHYGADAMTIQPYLGGADLSPLLRDPSKLGIVLAHTSNPGAGEFQHLQLQSGRKLWEHVADSVAHDERWHHGSPVGIVMGATFPEEIGKARYMVGDDVVMLIPGIGKQSGDLDASVRGAMNSRGNGFVINVSSAISQAKDSENNVTSESVREAALKWHNEIHSIWMDETENPSPKYYERALYEFDAKLANALFDGRCFKFGDFTLKSGAQSPIYLDLRASITDPNLRNNITQLYVDMVERQEEGTGVKADLIAGNPQAGTPYGTLVADRLGRRLVQPRAGGPKDHGTGNLVEGDFEEGETLRIVEDLLTTGTSVLETIEHKLEPVKLRTIGVVALASRGQGGDEAMAEAGLPLEYAITLQRLMTALRNSDRLDRLDARMRQEVFDYLKRLYGE